MTEFFIVRLSYFGEIRAARMEADRLNEVLTYGPSLVRFRRTKNNMTRMFVIRASDKKVVAEWSGASCGGSGLWDSWKRYEPEEQERFWFEDQCKALDALPEEGKSAVIGFGPFYKPRV